MNVSFKLDDFSHTGCREPLILSSQRHDSDDSTDRNIHMVKPGYLV
jgi:hypothetical protein